jgi:hypothetical protein
MSTSPGTAPDALRACGLHASASVGSVGFGEQEGHGGPMLLIERLTAAETQLRSPPFLITAAA